MKSRSREIYTIGHSNRPIGDLIALLKGSEIRAVADVRTIPRSRFNPQFNAGALRTALEKASIDYEPFPELGGLRHPRKDSPNTGWRNASFRGYADYMGTGEFAAGLARLEKAARERRTAVMCAEALPWRCHRSLIADALIAEGWRVCDIIGKNEVREHDRTPFLKVRNGQIIYPKVPG